MSVLTIENLPGCSILTVLKSYVSVEPRRWNSTKRLSSCPAHDWQQPMSYIKKASGDSFISARLARQLYLSLRLVKSKTPAPCRSVPGLPASGQVYASHWPPLAKGERGA
jgi:hypothetical protein